MGQWKGMNFYANRELKAGFKIKPMEVFIDDSISDKEKDITLKHEIVEIYYMKKGLSYKDAHSAALAFEDE